MPTASKPKRTSRGFSAAEVARAKDQAAKVGPTRGGVSPIDWDKAVVSRGGGVAATIDAVRRTRGPNKNPTKELVAIRIDRDVLAAFRASGPRWQTRMNAALKAWLVRHSGELTRNLANALLAVPPVGRDADFRRAHRSPRASRERDRE
jgi:uncharacterized protein (DUF4415 family)